jgi:predicted enzyme related to lactoylglutathione lyase
MTESMNYPPGAPCWVDSFQPEPRAAAVFYSGLFGWKFDAPRPMPAGLPGEYLPARLDGRLVSGIRQAVKRAVWMTHVRVRSVEDTVATAIRCGGGLLIGPLDAAFGGRMAILSDPTGVPFAVREADDGAQLVNAPGAWTMSALHTPSVERATAFYGALFGWESQAIPGASFSAWRLPGYVAASAVRSLLPRDVVALVAPIEDRDAVPPHWAVNFRVADADATAKRALTLGGTLVMAPTDTPGFPIRNAVIQDPAGGVVAISAFPDR